VGFGGVLAGDASITQAWGYYLPTNTFLYTGISGGGEQGVPGWNPAFASLEVSPGIFSTASTGTTLTTIAATSQDYLTAAQADRLGTFTTNGNAGTISFPYTFSSSTCSECVTVNQVYVDIFGTSYGAGASYSDGFGNPPTHSESGTLSVDLTGLPPGTYSFDAGVASSAVFVPEPGTLLLLACGIGLLGIFYRNFRIRNS
jgi:hypothetical protein